MAPLLVSPTVTESNVVANGMARFAPTARVISSTCRLVSSVVPERVAGETVMVSPTSLTISLNMRLMLLPMIPSVAIATTPMAIPVTARTDLSQWRLTFRRARSKKVMPASHPPSGSCDRRTRSSGDRA